MPDSPATVGQVLAGSPRLKRRGQVAWWTWRDIVGERVATRSSPSKLEGGTLLVTVKSSLWAQELSLLTPLILERLAARSLHVNRLRFVVGEIRLPRRPHARKGPKPGPLPAGLAERLERLQDDKLRQLIREAASLVRSSASAHGR